MRVGGRIRRLEMFMARSGMISYRDPGPGVKLQVPAGELVEDLARIVTHGQRDGQADAKPVFDEFEDLIHERRVSLRHR